ncbi:MAG: hypothetical protein KGQ81_08770 [Cyanobacteria bacterium REEB498]|nr:hypothetical protein [Cyanobacteria bacterium REEB498]
MRFPAHRIPVGLITRRLRGIPLLLALVGAGAPATAALNSFSKLDQVGRWVIERKNTAEGAITCRAYIPSGGTWFNSNVRIGADGAVLVPDGLSYSPDAAELSLVQEALRRCRADMIYVP